MYNDRTKQMESELRNSLLAPRARVNPSPNRSNRDIPEYMHNNSGMMPRRRCDGTRISNDNDTIPVGLCAERESDCVNGICTSFGLVNYPVAMVYSPCQAWRDAYAPDVALKRGTLFAALDLPFEAANNKRGCM